MEVAYSFGIKGLAVVWSVVDGGFKPDGEISEISWVISEFVWRVIDLAHIPVPGFARSPYASVHPSKAVGFVAVFQVSRVTDPDCTVV